VVVLPAGCDQAGIGLGEHCGGPDGVTTATNSTNVLASCSPPTLRPCKPDSERLPGGVDTTILVLPNWQRVAAMNSRVRVRVRPDLNELVDAGLYVAAFCAAASPLVARAVPSSAGSAESPTLVCPRPGSFLGTGVYGPDCEIDTAAQMRWERVDDDVNKSINVVRNPT
jgi:hypothetical protein